MTGCVRVACYQSGVSGIAAGAGWDEVLGSCGAQRVDLLVTPEFAVGGLPHTAEAARARALDDVDDLLVFAERAPEGLTMLLGFTERTSAGLHSSAAVIRDRRCLQIVRKLHPREPGLVPGEPSSVFEVGESICGVLICADATHAAPAVDLTGAGARVLACMLNNDMSIANATRWEGSTHRALSDRARDTGCWVVSADVAGASKQRRALAATRVIAPDGQVLAAAVPEPDTLLVVDVE